MHYQINRGGQMYGPYTLADLKRYVESGHILPTDLTQGDEMTEWVPVSEVLNPGSAAPGLATAPVAPPALAAAYPPQLRYVPAAQLADPPNLHWVFVLLITWVTGGLFQMVWNIIVAAWMRRLQPRSKALAYYLSGYLLLFLFFAMYVPAVIEVTRHMLANDSGFRPEFAHPGLMFLAALASWVLRLMARFNMKSSLEEHFNTVEPIGLRMSGFMTFFFGGLYIQAKLSQINEIKRAIRYGQYGR